MAAATGAGARTSCRELMALLHTEPSPFLDELERRVAAGRRAALGRGVERGLLARTCARHLLDAREDLSRASGESRSLIIEGKLRSRGTQNFYQVRVGADTRQGAMDLCAALHKAGAACLVPVNSHGNVQPL